MDAKQKKAVTCHQMRSPANIAIPVQNVVKIGRTDEEALDFLFDLKVDDLPKVLAHQASFNQPGIMIVAPDMWPITALVIFKPPLGMRLFKGQEYLVYAGSNITMLIDYFKGWNECNRNIYLRPILAMICDRLQVTCRKPRKQYIPEAT